MKAQSIQADAARSSNISAAVATMQYGFAGMCQIRADGVFPAALLSEGAASLERWASNPDVYCVILRSVTDEEIHRPEDTGSQLAPLPHPLPALERSAMDPADLRAEHELVWQLDRYPKPLVAMLSRWHANAAVGFAAVATHRLGLPDFAVQLNAVRLGGLPSHGLSAILSRWPNQIGAYLVLSGRILGRADAYQLGLLTHCVPAGAEERIIAKLAAAECVDPVLDAEHVHPGVGELAAYEGVIGNAFAQDTLAGILDCLRVEAGGLKSWARKLADELEVLDPQRVALALAMLRRPLELSLRNVLQQDIHICLHMPDYLAVTGGTSQWSEWFEQTGSSREALLPKREFIPSVPAPVA